MNTPFNSSIYNKFITPSHNKETTETDRGLLKYHPFRLQHHTAYLASITADIQSRHEKKDSPLLGDLLTNVILEKLIRREDTRGRSEEWIQEQSDMILTTAHWFNESGTVYHIHPLTAARCMATDAMVSNPCSIRTHPRTLYLHWGSIDGFTQDGKHVDGAYVQTAGKVLQFHITTRHPNTLHAGITATEYLHHEPHYNMAIIREKNYTLGEALEDYAHGDMITDNQKPDFIKWRANIEKACRLILGSMQSPATMSQLTILGSARNRKHDDMPAEEDEPW